MPDVQHKRGSRADLNTLAAANGLLLGQIYVITDEDRLAVATGVGSYQAAEKEGGGGGSALELYAENPSSPTAPSATGANAVAIGSGALATDVRAVALGLSRADGDDAFAAAIGATNLTYGARATGAVAIGYQASATALQATAVGTNATATGSRSQAIGYNSDATNTNSNAFGNAAQATGVDATAIGRAYASGTDSFAAAIANNSSSYGATGANSVAMGRLAKASGTESFSAGELCVASGGNSVAIGRNATADAANSVSLGNYADSDGIGSRLTFGIVGATSGQQQMSFFTSEMRTSDVTPVEIGFSDIYRHKLKNNTAHAFSGTIVARQQASDGTACAAWEIKGLIRREGSAGTTVLVNSATTVLDNTPSWGMALTANTTRGGLAITVTGAAATNIRWVSAINTSEVTY